MNKKLILNLLGGGVAISLASFGGLKINDSVEFNKRINHYKKINEEFSKNLTGQFDNYYLPNWEDDSIWKSMHDLLPKNYVSSDPYDKWPTPQSLRDHCYQKATIDKTNADCNGTWGWCEDCIRNRDWDKKS